MKKLIKSLLFLSILSSSFLSAQDSKPILATSFYNGNEVMLRWIPGNYETFDQGLLSGYEITRYLVKEEGTRLQHSDMIASATNLTPSGLLPQPLSDWSNLTISDNDIKNVGEAAIYSDDFIITDMSNVDPLKIYSLSKERENRYSFGLYAADQDFELAKFMGLAFKDLSSVAGNEYAYKIHLISGDVELDGFTKVETIYEGSVKPVIEQVNANPADMFIQLRWNGEQYAKDYPLGYYIEKKYSNTTWTEVSTKPVVYLANSESNDPYIYFQDSVRSNTEKVYYRIRGKSFFDGYGPYTEIQTQGIPAPLDAQLYIESVTEITETNSVQIDFNFPTDLTNKIDHFEIYRNSTRYGNYELVTASIPGANRSFTDSNPISTAYYKMKLVDINGGEVSSFPILFQLNDLVAPIAPQEVTCSCNKEGNVVIKWAKNNEEDVRGYNVFSSNHAENGEFVQLTNEVMFDTVFTTSINLNNLTKYIYFKVRAIDYRENYSLLSVPCEMEKPDIIAPTAAALYAVDPLIVGVGLHYQVSTSEDIVSQFIQRKRDGGNWETLAFVDDINQEFYQNLEDGEPTFDNVNPYKDYEFIDTTTTYEAYYTYRITAVDGASNKSYSNMIRVKPHDPGIRGEIENLTAKFMKINDKEYRVILQWDYTYTKGLYDFQIFRSSNSPQFPNAQYPASAYSVLNLHDSGTDITSSDVTVGTTSFEFTDGEVDFSRKYQYQVMARHVDGGFSKMSVKVSPSKK
ncbi:hypothetical protein N9B82_05440 [Saprospiraceae bacterium]|nr:hypothetical protein [Saprospiraceae bacterium]